MKKETFLGLIAALVLIFLVKINVAQSAPANAYIEGEGRFYANEDDSLDFVKKQLLFSAFQDVLSKELSIMGLESGLFWQKFDERFEEYFKPIQEGLEKKYKIVSGKGKNKKEYQRTLRSKRLKSRRLFGKLGRAISSYSIKKTTYSTQIANSRYMNLQAKVDRKYLAKLFYRITAVSDRKSYENLLLDVQFDLERMSWADLGVELPADFTTVVIEHWQNWLGENLKHIVKNVQVVKDDDRETINRFLKTPQDLFIGKSDGQEEEEPGHEYWNDLLLNVTVKVKKIGENILLQYRDISIDGDFILIDLQSRHVLSHFDFVPYEGRYNTGKARELSSNVASFIYNIPIPEFTPMKRVISQALGGGHKLRLEVENVANIDELMKIKEVFAIRGGRYRVKTDVLFYTGNKVALMVSYSGENQKFIEDLLLMDNTAIGDNKVLSFSTREFPYELVLREKMKSSSGSTKRAKEPQGT